MTDLVYLIAGVVVAELCNLSGYLFHLRYIDKKLMKQSQPAKPQAPKQPPITGGLTTV